MGSCSSEKRSKNSSRNRRENSSHIKNKKKNKTKQRPCGCLTGSPDRGQGGERVPKGEPIPRSRGARPLAGFGTESRGLALDLKGRRSQRKGRGSTPDGPQASERGTRSAAKEAGRAIPLSWEIKDFPTHGEPQAVCRNVAALSLTVRCRLQLGSR